MTGPDVIFLTGSAAPGAVMIFTALGSAGRNWQIASGLALALSGLGAATAAMTGSWWAVAAALACAGVTVPSAYRPKEKTPSDPPDQASGGRDAGLTACSGCGALPGGFHAGGCVLARCPECGVLRVVCAEHRGNGRAARWWGVDPVVEVARGLGWWAVVVGVDHLVEDCGRVGVAGALGQVWWEPGAQRLVVGVIDEGAIDRARGAGGPGA